jgi:hypothetical protein
MTRTLRRATLVTLVLIGIGAVTIWTTARPYQQDRILIELGLKAR